MVGLGFFVICLECAACGHRAVTDRRFIEMNKPGAKEPYKFRCEMGCRGDVRRLNMTMRDAQKWYRAR
ncbi:hypothetical protein GCM10028812_47040 [Ancylobacter sonchi]